MYCRLRNGIIVSVIYNFTNCLVIYVPENLKHRKLLNMTLCLIPMPDGTVSGGHHGDGFDVVEQNITL